MRKRINRKKTKTLSCTIDCNNPYSDVQLFLSRQMKSDVLKTDKKSEWTLEREERLVKQIAPLFQKQFPDYYLSVAALKKAWEKMIAFYRQIASVPEALLKEGTLNIDFFIKENVTASLRYSGMSNIRFYSHTLATKIGGYQALFDGARPNIAHIHAKIWAIIRNLTQSVQQERTHDTFDVWMLETASKVLGTEKRLSQENFREEMQSYLKRRISSLKRFGKGSKILLDEIAKVLCDYPDLPAKEAEKKALTSLRTELKLLEKADKIEEKIERFVLQNDMLFRWIDAPKDSSLYQLLCQEGKKGASSHGEVVNRVWKNFLQTHPHLKLYAAPLKKRVWSLYKTAWYQDLGKEMSPYERFLRWEEKEVSLDKLVPLFPAAH